MADGVENGGAGTSPGTQRLSPISRVLTLLGLFASGSPAVAPNAHAGGAATVSPVAGDKFAERPEHMNDADQAAYRNALAVFKNLQSRYDITVARIHVVHQNREYDRAYVDAGKAIENDVGNEISAQEGGGKRGRGTIANKVSQVRLKHELAAAKEFTAGKRHLVATAGSVFEREQIELSKLLEDLNTAKAEVEGFAERFGRTPEFLLLQAPSGKTHNVVYGSPNDGAPFQLASDMSRQVAFGIVAADEPPPEMGREKWAALRAMAVEYLKEAAIQKVAQKRWEETNKKVASAKTVAGTAQIDWDKAWSDSNPAGATKVTVPEDALNMAHELIEARANHAVALAKNADALQILQKASNGLYEITGRLEPLVEEYRKTETYKAHRSPLSGPDGEINVPMPDDGPLWPHHVEASAGSGAPKAAGQRAASFAEAGPAEPENG